MLTADLSGTLPSVDHKLCDYWKPAKSGNERRNDMDTIIIPTHERPELLHVCLEHLAKVEGIDSKHVLICEDYHTDRPKSAALQSEILETVDFAKTILPSVEHIRTEHTNYGFSYNVIEGFRRTVKSNAEFIYYLEDDCLPTRDWFKFAEAAHDLCPDCFCVCGNARPQSRTQESNVVHLDANWLQTFALSFRREQLQKLLLPDYADYKIRKDFEFDRWMLEQMRSNFRYSVSGCHERVYTFGFYSYHIGGESHPGGLSERVAHIKQAMSDPASLGGGYARDFVQYRECAPWTTLSKRSSIGQRIR